MKRLFYPPPCREFIVVIALLLLGNQLVLGEGSKDFWDYPGFRLFYLIAPTPAVNETNYQQTKVYASSGEFINVGSSHVGIVGGFISVYRPDGSLHSRFDGSNGLAIINNNIEELAGPTGGGNTNGQGYNPGVVQVQAGEAGVWTVILDYPPENENASVFPNILNGTAWTRAADQPTNGRVSLAWDITVTQSAAGNNGGTAVEGRVYSNEYRSMVSGNGNTTSPTFFILTRSGYLYQVDFDQADPFGFPIYSNSRGIVDSDQMATYSSWNFGNFTRSGDPSSWQEGMNYLYDPQAEDSGLLWNNKVFFNSPDPNMPAQATVTDIRLDQGTQNTHSTWLFSQVPALNEGQNPFGFSGNVPAGGICDPNLTMEEGEGGSFVFSSQVPGLAQLRLDLNNNGSFDDPVDRFIEAEAVLGGTNDIFWDGLDGQGNVIGANPNFQFNYELKVRGGEVHILMEDVENNLGGVTISRLNGVNSPDDNFFYDHSNVGGPVSGGGTAGNARPGNAPYTYSGNAGNMVLLDSWAFVEASNFGTGILNIQVIGDCTPAPTPVLDNDGDGIPDDVDLDDDNDGISDIEELAVALNNGDTDGDGVPDIFDLDSDNDGILDLIEAGHTQLDVNGDGVIDGSNFGNNGLHNSLETSDTFDAVLNYTPVDTDGDGVRDHIDLDSDNDGILDVRENNGSDPDNDGIIGNGTPTVNVNGIVVSDANGNTIVYNILVDTDRDGTGDFRDLDSDDDGLFDVAEAGLPDGSPTVSVDGILGVGTPPVDINGVPSATDSNGNTVTSISNPPDTFGNGNSDFQEINPAPPVDPVDPVDPVVDCNDPANIPAFGPLSGDGTFCAGQSAAPAVSGITNGISGGSTFTWTGPNGFTQSGSLDNINSVYQIQLPGLTTAESGNYTLTVTTDLGCSASVTIPVSVQPAPQAPTLTGPTNGLGGCAGSTVRLNASGGGTTYQWIRDGVVFATTAEPFLDVSDSGTYSVSVTQNGCPSPSSNAVAISFSTPPAVGIGGPSGDVCGGGLIQFTATNLGAGTVYTWYRNGQAIATTNEPLFSIPNATTADNAEYTVSASQNGCAGGQSAATTLAIGQGGASVGIGGTSGQVCSGEDVTITATDLGAGTTYEWFRDGVLIQRTTEPSLQLGGATDELSGGYTVVAVKDGCTGTPSSVLSIDVSSTSQIPSNLIIDNPVLCEGDTFIIRANEAIGNVTYRWFLDGTDFAVTNRPFTTVQGVTLANTGSYSVEVTLEGCASVLSSAVDVTVIPAVTTSLTADQTNFCSGETVMLNAQANETGLSFDWLVDGVAFAATSDPFISVSGDNLVNGGTYTVRPRNSQCSNSVSNGIVLSVTEAPNGGTITPNNTSLCSGETLSLSASDLGAGTNYEWFRDGVSLGSTPDPAFNIGATAGTYTMIPTRNGCEGTASNAVTISVGDAGETPSLTTDNPNICVGDNLVLNASGVGGTPNYEWFRDGESLGATSDPFFSVSNAMAGEYTVVVSGGECGGGSSNAVTITVSETPPAGEITPANNSLCEGETLSISSTDLGAGVSYNWYQGDQLISTTDTPLFEVGAIPSSSGTYTMIPSIGDCQGPSSNAVQISVGEASTAPSLSASNPNLCAGDALTLNASGVGGDAAYEWFRDGESVGTSDQPTFTVDAPVAGNYTVAATGGDCGGGTSEALTVTVSDAPTTGAVSTPNASVCEGDAVSLTTADAGVGAVYNWFLNGELVATTDTPTFEVAASATTIGTYTVNTAIGSCEGMPSEGLAVAIAEPGAAPTIALNDGTGGATLCPGDGVTLTAMNAGGATGFEWFRDGESIGTSMDGSFVVDNPLGGNYTVATTGGCGGGTSEPVSLAINELPDVTSNILPIPNLDCGVSSTSIEANLPAGVEGRWSSSDPNVVFSNPNSAITTVSGLGTSSNVTWTLSDPTCGVDVSTSSSTISVNAVSSVTDIPDVITPNNDGFNDALRIPDADCVNVGLKVFNRWGDLVYEVDRYNNNDAWEGTHDGDPLPPGPYYYLLTEAGSDEKRSGCVSIYR